MKRGRPRLYEEPTERLHVIVRASVAKRLRDQGINVSRLVDQTLADFLDGITDKASRLAELLDLRQEYDEHRKGAGRLRENLGLSLDELYRIKRESQDLSRSVTQRLRNAAQADRPALVQVLRRVRRICGDADAQIERIEPEGSHGSVPHDTHQDN